MPGWLFAKTINTKPEYSEYPFGVAGEKAIEAVKQQGYKAAFTANTDISFVDFSDTQLDYYKIPRTLVYKWNITDIDDIIANTFYSFLDFSKSSQ